MTEDNIIFLYDTSILPWERPQKDVISMLHLYNGSTELVRMLGFEALDASAGAYRVVGSATKFLADIAHLEKYPSKEDAVALEPKREVLLIGGLDIYIDGNLSGTAIRGYDLLRRGIINFSTEASEECFFDGILKSIVLGKSPDDVSRIEAILDGYQVQEDQNKEKENVIRRKN